MPSKTHQFAAVAFEENLSLKELLPAYPGARATLRELRAQRDGGELFIYPFGAIVFHDLSPEQREAELARLRGARPGLTTQVVRETFTVREEPGQKVDMVEETLGASRFVPARAPAVALIVAHIPPTAPYQRFLRPLS